MEKIKILYAICGHAQNGKDSTADAMQAELKKKGIFSVRESFARLLKDQAKELGWDGVKNEAGRTLLQHLGDVQKEYHGRDYYARECLNRIEESKENIFFVTDVRFKYELNAVKEFGKKEGIKSVIIRVIRPQDGTWDDGLTEAQRHHISECDLNDVKIENEIQNDGTLDDLSRKAAAYLPNDDVLDIIRTEQGSAPAEVSPVRNTWDPHNNRPRILFDCDDVITDFLGTLLKEYNKRKGTNLHKTEFRSWNLLDAPDVDQDIINIFHEPGFFEKVPPKGHSVDVIQQLIESTRYDVYVVTACSSVEELAEKRYWFQHMIPSFNTNRIIMCNEKSLVRGDLIVDDKVANLDQCAPYMKCILYSMPTNKGDKTYRRIRSLQEVLPILDETFYK
jgi:5'-nucleotidase